MAQPLAGRKGPCLGVGMTSFGGLALEMTNRIALAGDVRE
jgi:hypothetical protein